jgi:two-component system, OmpR family, sensor kinase
MQRQSSKSMSLIHRLILLLTVSTAAVWLAAASFGLLVLTHKLNQSLDSALQETAQRLLALAVHEVFEQEEDEKTHEIAETEIAEHDEYLKYQLRDASGRLLLRSHDAPATPYPAPLTTGFSNTPDLRIYTEGTISDSFFIQVAEPHAYRRAALWETTLALLAPLPFLIALSTVAVTYMVRGTLRPLVDLKDAIQLRGMGNLTPIGITALPRELAPIAHAVDRFLERLQAALDAERAFAANSAHELRTPLASVLAQVQRLSATLKDDVAEARVKLIESDLVRLRGLTEKLLQLSRVEAGLGMLSNNVDLMPVLRLVVDEFAGRGSNGQRLRFDSRGIKRLSAHLDADAFAIVVRNLIENALLHGAPDEPVYVFLSKPLSVHVVNGGPVVGQERLAKLKHRFERGATTAKGAGLGLAISDTILRQCGGRLLLRSPATGKADGFEAIAVVADE